MSNYDNVDWTGTAINQKNRGAILDYALSPEGQAYQKEYDTQAKIGKVIAGNEDIINPGAFQGNPSSRYEATKYNTAYTPSVGQIIDYMMRSGTTSKDVPEFVKQSGDEIFTATGKYSLDPEGKLSRKYSYNTEDTGKKWYDFSGSGLLSGLTLGLSDVVKGHMPGTDWADQGILTQIVNPASQVHSMFTGGAADLVYGIDKAGRSDGDFWSKAGVAVDRAMDPFGVDTMVRTTGDIARDINPEKFDKYVAPYAGAAGTAIGALIYGGPGAAAGYGIGTKFGQGTRNYDYLKDLATAATIYATYGAGSGAGSAVKDLTGSAVLGGATSGAVSGAMSGVPTAIQQGSWDPIWQGALSGGVTGGIGSGARIGAYGLGASKAIANLTGNVAGKLASSGMKQLWLNNNKG